MTLLGSQTFDDIEEEEYHGEQGNSLEDMLIPKKHFRKQVVE